MSWPYLPHHCPRCNYFKVFDPVAHDDVGYELPGACAHPRIGMELFVARGELAQRLGECDPFVRAPTTPGSERLSHARRRGQRG